MSDQDASATGDSVVFQAGRDILVPGRVEVDWRTAPPLVVDVGIRDADYVTSIDGDGVVEDVPADGHTVRLVVTGQLPRPVLLTDLRVEVTATSSRFGELSPHAAEVPKRRFTVLLDASPPVVVPAGNADFPFQLAEFESEAFDLEVRTDAGEVEWLLWLDWRCGPRSGSVRVDLGGHGFRTAGRPW